MVRFHDECILPCVRQTDLCILAWFQSYFGAFFHYRYHGLMRNGTFIDDCDQFI